MITSDPTISVIIPAHNEEKYLAKTLASIKSQTFQDFEIIVVASSCNDRTASIARQFDCETIEANTRCPAENRNLGAKKAKGCILVFWDADVRVSQDYLQQIHDAVESGAKCGRPLYYYDSTNPIARNLLFIRNRLITGGFPHTCFVRRSCFFDVGGYSETMNWEDLIFADKMKKRHKICIVDSRAYNSTRRFDRNGFFRETFSQAFSVARYFVFYKLLKIDNIPALPPVR